MRRVDRGPIKPPRHHFPNAMTDQPLPDTAFGAAPSTSDPFQAAKASAMKAAEELRTAAAQKAQELRQAAESRAQQFKATAEHKASEIKDRATAKAEEFRDYASSTFSDAKTRYNDLRGEAETFAREKPMQALITAFGVGLFVGLLLRK